MVVLNKKSDLQDVLISRKGESKNIQIGFVPTMGFLHSGHLSLIDKSTSENDITVCSIFINPLQFNEKLDFESYPKDFDKDILMLKEHKCNIVYIPTYEEIYPNSHQIREYDFKQLDKVMEGVHRKGHFQGVAEVVRILFEHVQPDRAYFGEKDFQQLLIIKDLVKQLDFSIEIVGCPIVREKNGLAMSSRNSLLSTDDREKASFIWQQLEFCVQEYANYTPTQLKDIVVSKFLKETSFELIYIEIVNRETLMSIQNWSDAREVCVFCAARIGGVRLIDNVRLF